MKANILLLLVSSIIAFLLGEAGIRLIENYQYSKFDHSQYGQIYSDERNTPYIYGHLPNVDVELNNGEHKYRFISNSQGLREENDYSSLKKSIIFLGDSIIEGSSVENHQSLDSVFEQQTGVTSLNFGVGSYNTAHEYLYLSSKYRHDYNTKLIVLGFCLNDFANRQLLYFDNKLGNWKLFKTLNDGGKKAAQSSFNIVKEIKGILGKSKFIVFVKRSLSDLTLRLPSQDRYNRIISAEELVYTDMYITKIQKFSEDIDADLVVVIFPFKSQLFTLKKNSTGLQKIIKSVLNKHQIPYIDLFEPMKNRILSEPEIQWYHDDVHPSAAGHEFIANYLAQEFTLMFPGVFK